MASVSILLNGGGLGQLQEITQTFAKALAGREDEMRSLLTQLDVFIKQLNDQTDDIITATENLNKLAGQFAAKNDTVDRALTTIPQAISVLADLARNWRTPSMRSASSAPSRPRRSSRRGSRW